MRVNVCAGVVQMQCVTDLQCFSALCPRGFSRGLPDSVRGGGVSLWTGEGAGLSLRSPIGVRPDVPRPRCTAKWMAGGEPVL